MLVLAADSGINPRAFTATATLTVNIERNLAPVFDPFITPQTIDETLPTNTGTLVTVIARDPNVQIVSNRLK